VFLTLLPVKTPTCSYVPLVAVAEFPAYILIASNPVNVEEAYVPAQETSMPAKIRFEVNPFGFVGDCIVSPTSATVIVKVVPTVLVTPDGDVDLS